MSCIHAALQELPKAVSGPYVKDADGLPRFTGTIWVDFLNVSRADSTRSRYARAAEALYREAESLSPAVDLDAALLGGDIDALNAVLSASLLRLQAKRGHQPASEWALSQKFVFDVLRYVDGNDHPDFRRRLDRSRELYRQLRPSAPRPPSPVRALPAEVVEDLCEIFHPESCRNPFRTKAIRWRNFTVFLMLLHMGLRAGELLGLPASALSFEFDSRTGATRHWIDIGKAHSLVDGRGRPARLKNQSSVRQLPLPPEIGELCDAYLTSYRGEPAHGFLLSSQEGRPMGVSTLQLIIDTAFAELIPSSKRALERASHSRITPHDFRHTSAVVRLQRYRETGISQEEAVERLRPFFGWSRDSRMPFRYARAYFEPRYRDVWDETFAVALQALRDGAGDVP